MSKEDNMSQDEQAGVVLGTEADVVATVTELVNAAIERRDAELWQESYSIAEKRTAADKRLFAAVDHLKALSTHRLIVAWQKAAQP